MKIELVLKIDVDYIYPEELDDASILEVDIVNASDENVSVDEAVKLEISLPVGEAETDLIRSGPENEPTASTVTTGIKAEKSRVEERYLVFAVRAAAEPVLLKPQDSIRIQFRRLKIPILVESFHKMSHVRFQYKDNAPQYHPLHKRSSEAKLAFDLVGGERKNAYNVGYGDMVTVEWSGTQLDACVLYPYKWEDWTDEVKRKKSAFALNPIGKLRFSVYRDMELILRGVRKTEPQIQRRIKLTVPGGEALSSLTVTPPRAEQPVKAGQAVTFKASCTRTRHGYMDRGIGRVNMEPTPGTPDTYEHAWTLVPETNLKTYTFSVLHKDGAEKMESKSVKAGGKGILELANLSYRIDQQTGKNQYYLNWEVVNSDGSVKITDSKGGVRSDGKAAGNLAFTDSGPDILRLTIEAAQKEELGKQKLYLSDIVPKVVR